jgi:hypothetical protein
MEVSLSLKYNSKVKASTELIHMINRQADPADLKSKIIGPLPNQLTFLKANLKHWAGVVNAHTLIACLSSN